MKHDWEFDHVHERFLPCAAGTDVCLRCGHFPSWNGRDGECPGNDDKELTDTPNPRHCGDVI